MDSRAGSQWTGDKKTKLANYVLRSVAIVFTLIGAILVGAAAQTAPVTDGFFVGEQKYKAAGTIQFDYLIAVNAIVCFYSLVSIVLWALVKGSTHTLNFILTMVDIIAMILLFTGLASASGLIIYQSEQSRLCKVLDTLCAQVSASSAMTALAGIAYLLLLVFSFLRLHLLSME